MNRPGICTVAACLFAVMVVAGCAARGGAPVVDRGAGKKSAPMATAPARRAAPQPPDARPDFHTVRKGDTLYSIALDHGLDYRELAEWNGLKDAAAIRVGQALRLKPPATGAAAAPLKTAPGVQARPIGEPAQAAGMKTQPRGVRAPYSDQAYAELAAGKPEVKPSPAASPDSDGSALTWGWPTSGRLVATFNDGSKLKGISIAGKLGQPIVASAPGRVIFSGTGIRGFGKLIVIKHNSVFLSVYAHNSELLVKEGQTVAKGQRIAEMGSTDTDRVKLHFEIRRYGKPVDPVKLLPPA